MKNRLSLLLICLMLVQFGFAQVGDKNENWENEASPEEEKILDPNPTYGKLQIDVSRYDHAFYDLSVKNIIGKKMWTKTIYEPIQILDLSQLRKGSYLFAVSSPLGEYLEVLRLVIVDP